MTRTGRQRELFKESLQRCITDIAFLDRFYRIFQDASEDVRNKFKKTDFVHQKFILRASLYIMETVADSGQPTPALVDLAKKHDRNHYAVKAELYDIWLDAMIMAVADTDPDYTEEIGLAWRQAMEAGIAVMKSMY